MSARVLVVDDLAPNVKLLEARLTADYFNVITAASGPEAIEIVRSSPPDIVLLDVMMPGMDGFEVCRRLKADPKTCHVPIVLVTALYEITPVGGRTASDPLRYAPAQAPASASAGSASSSARAAAVSSAASQIAASSTTRTARTVSSAPARWLRRVSMARRSSSHRTPGPVARTWPA